MRHIVMTAGLALAVASFALPRAASAAGPVVQVVNVQVKPGMSEQYRQELKKVRGVMTRLGSKATLRAWNTVPGGTASGQTLVGIEYPDAAAWAADSVKLQADAEWQKIQAGLAAIRTVVSASVWRDISPEKSAGAGGGTLVFMGVAVKPGKLDDYLARVKSAMAISTRLGNPGRIRVWQAEFAGENAGAVGVGMEYADVASYVSAQEKLAADAEWQKAVAGLDEVRSLAGRTLYQEIAP